MDIYHLTPVGILESRAREMISNVFLDLLDKVNYSVKSYIPNKANEIASMQNGIADGAYEEGVIYLHQQSLIETAIHEIGHAIHYQLFGGRDLKLRTGKLRNHKEEFAELFTDVVLKSNYSHALNKDEVKLFTLIVSKTS